MDSMELYWAITSHTSKIIYLILFSVLAGIFIKPFLENPKAAKITGAAYLSSMLVLYFMPYEIEGTTAYSIGCAVICAAMYLLDKRNIRQKIILSISLLLFNWIVHGVVLIFWDFIFNYWIPRLSGQLWLQFAAYVFTEFLYLLFNFAGTLALIKITNRLYREKKASMSNQEFIFMLLPLLPCLAGYYFFHYFTGIYEQDTNSSIWDAHGDYLWLTALYKIFCGGVILVVTAIIQTIKRQQKESKENAVLARQVMDMENHIREMEKIYRDIRGLRHDMGNHMMTLETLYKKQEWKEAEDYSQKIKESLEKFPFSIHSCNPITDIILEEMRRTAEEKGFSFQSEFTFGTDTNVDTFDISIILSNALTNAIENADGDVPYIHILSYRKKNAFMIEIRNSFTGKVVFSNDGELLQTSKADRQNHGYGLSNIRKTARKYHGDIMMQTRDGEFILTVMLMFE